MFLLHGWMDCSASFQFLVDALKGEWDIIAPDLRGMGLSQWQNDTYWFSDFIPDLDRIFDLYSQDQPAVLVGHSMGASISSLFAGMRPERVAQLVFLEGYGIPPQNPELRASHFEDWLEAKKNGMRPNRGYADKTEFAQRLMDANPRLSQERAEFLAIHFTCKDAAGRVIAAVDPWHRQMFSVLTNIEDMKRIWRRVTAPLLWVVAADSATYARFATRRDEYLERLNSFRDVREVVVAHAGHNLHHDQPHKIAALIEQFIAEVSERAALMAK